MVKRGIFITGTDTGVGKTLVASALALLLRNRGIRVAAMKPVTSGCSEENGILVSDDARLLAFSTGQEENEDLAPYRLRHPIAPSAAAEIDGVTIDFFTIENALSRLEENHTFVIVEGAGGLMVPLSGGLLVADLVNRLGLPILIVARPDLGTVNHTILTCFAARQLGIDVKGVVINGYPEEPNLAESTAPHLIDSLCGSPLLGRFPRFDDDDPRGIIMDLATWLENQPATNILLREIGCV